MCHPQKASVSGLQVYSQHVYKNNLMKWVRASNSHDNMLLVGSFLGHLSRNQTLFAGLWPIYPLGSLPQRDHHSGQSVSGKGVVVSCVKSETEREATSASSSSSLKHHFHQHRHQPHQQHQFIIS